MDLSKKIRELRKKIAAKADEAKALLETDPLTDEIRSKVDEITSEIEELRADLERAEALLEAERQGAIEIASRANAATVEDSTEVRGKVVRNFVLGKHLSDRERELGETSLGLDFERGEMHFNLRDSRALSVGTGSAGGYTVPEDDTFIGQVESALLAFGGMRQAATVLRTADGGDLPFTTVDDTSNTGVILAENTQVAEQDVAFGQLIIQAYKFSSKLVRASVELLQDSAVNIEAYLGGVLGTRIARALNTYATTGTGSSQPKGVVTAATAGVTAASATAITADELIDLFHSVDPAYRPNAVWMMNDSTVKAIRKLKDANNQYLWQPALTAGSPDMLIGRRVIVNNDMDEIATAKKTVLFGDLSKYLIRDVLGITVVVLRERYADYHQVGFLAFSRHDSDLLDAGTHPVKYLVQA